VAIQDLVGNALQPGATGMVLGYVEPSDVSELLSLEMYDFLIEPIRFKDAQEGALFLKRFLAGPQEIWRQTQEKIHGIKDLWNISKADHEQLHRLKRHVGWTPDLDSITEPLDTNTLRKLVAASIPLWKSRGPEDAIVRVLLLATGARSRVWNWFDFRWVLDETALEEEHAGRDPHLINLPGPPSMDEYRSNVRIVDDDTLNRDLVEGLIRLMRASGERIEVSYIDFLDLFTYDGDTTQWVTSVGHQLVVEGGTASLSNSAQEQMVFASTSKSSQWQSLVSYVRLRGWSISPGATFGVVFCYQDELNHYKVKFDTNNHSWELAVVELGVETSLANGILAPTIGYIWPDVYYGIRVHSITVGTETLIELFFDGQLFCSFDSYTPFTTGSFGVYHDNQSRCEFDEAEAFELPLDTVLIDINT